MTHQHQQQQIDNASFDAAVFETVSRRLLAKCIEEFTYEEIIDPEPVADGESTRYELPMATGVAYRFDATEQWLDSITVDPSSIERITDGTSAPATDPIGFVRDLGETIEIDSITLGNFVRELNNTLFADAVIEDQTDSTDVATLEYAQLEGAMTGHPWLVVNKGRLGFGASDHAQFAPERSEPQRLLWVGAHRELATATTTEAVSFESLLRSELGETLDQFREQLATKGLDPDAYQLLPVHQWQWDNYIAQQYARELATDQLVLLGPGPDRYLPQQSIRTFTNVDSPERHHVKVPLSIHNTLVWRGLPGERTQVAPIVTEFVHELVENDSYLSEECGLVVPGEIAAVDVGQPDFTAIEDGPYQYRELLGAIWRESIDEYCADDERAMTLAALIHVQDGQPVLSSLVERSELTLDEWIESLCETVVPPLIHCLYRYGTVFSPHGQNAMLLLEDDAPSRLAVKDLVDDVNVSDQPIPELEELSPELTSVLRSEPPEGLCQFIFAGLFVGVFRYLVKILETHHDYEERRFWEHVAGSIRAYQHRFPELEERFETFDLFQDRFTKLCLNRNRLFREGYADASGRPHAAEHGTVKNPLAKLDDRS
ncbi:IucA/IucC family protein [Halocatena halophila]|uniref:IucA/IucC family protein n=1 Tax=Halocatena halophila TaxID=2814576 RepID=UPI002ED5C930